MDESPCVAFSLACLRFFLVVFSIFESKSSWLAGSLSHIQNKGTISNSSRAYGKIPQRK